MVPKASLTDIREHNSRIFYAGLESARAHGIVSGTDSEVIPMLGGLVVQAQDHILASLSGMDIDEEDAKIISMLVTMLSAVMAVNKLCETEDEMKRESADLSDLLSDVESDRNRPS